MRRATTGSDHHKQGDGTTDFSQLDGRRVAVRLGACGLNKLIVQGLATFQLDNRLGRALRIRVDCADDDLVAPELLFQESTWRGRIIPDLQHGCDYFCECMPG